MLTQTSFQEGMQKLNTIDIGPYVKCRKGSKEKVGNEWLVKALVYVDQRDIYAMINSVFGEWNWQSQEEVSPDGKSVKFSIEFPVLVNDTVVHTYVYSSVCDLITNTKGFWDDKASQYSIPPQLLAEAGIPMAYVGNGKLAVLDMEEAIKGAASRACVRAATKFIASIANLYNFKSLYYSSQGKAPDLSKINFNAYVNVSEDAEEAHEDKSSVQPKDLAEVGAEEINLAVADIIKVLSQITNPDQKSERIALLKEAMKRYNEEIHAHFGRMDDKEFVIELKSGTLELVELEALKIICEAMVEEFKAEQPKAKPSKKSDPK